MSTARCLTPVDRLLAELDHALHTAFPTVAHTAVRTNPAAELPADKLNAGERRLSGRLMRINHAGEVAAQALYRGQAFTARGDAVHEGMAQSAAEEIDHLAWCEERLHELDSAPSRLDPLWYLGSFAIGATAGLFGDRFSLGFVAETERQVAEHLDGHLRRLPANDERSRAIIEQMKTDETRHGDKASRAGGIAMPAPLRMLMRLTSKVMTETAYWI
jgi:ubiquinone biosynthesis monooxygenase Coq7